MVGAVFVMLAISSGIGFYGMTIYLRALTETGRFSVGAISAATALFFLVSGIFGVPVASLIARYDPRVTVIAGAFSGAAALLLLGRVTVAWQVFLAYAVFGIGFAGCSLVPATTLVARWFHRRRSVALSVASTGLSAGGVLVTPAVAAAVARHGLPATAPWLALSYVVGIVPLTAGLLRADPVRMGLRPDGDPGSPVPVGTAARALAGTSAREAVRAPYFLAVTIAHLLAMLAQVGGIAHLYNLVADRTTSGTAASAVSLLAVSSLIGRLGGGWVATRVSLRGFTGSLMLAQGAALVGLGLGHTRGTLLLAAVGFGVTVGNLLLLHPLLLAERFGVWDYGRIYSRSSLVATAGIAVGPLAIGALHDGLGGYGAAFAFAGAASGLAAVALSFSGPSIPSSRR